MPMSYYLVLTRPLLGQEEAYHRWYTDRHIKDLVGIPGIEAAQRFSLFDVTRGETADDYLALYELSDVKLAVAGLAERRGTELMPSSDALDRTQSRGVICDCLQALPDTWSQQGGTIELFQTAAMDLAARPTRDVTILQAGSVQSRPGPLPFTQAKLGASDRSLHIGMPPGASFVGTATPITQRVLANS